jgi:hypothetical protein
VVSKPELYPGDFHKANGFCCRSAFDIMVLKSIQHSDFIPRILPIRRTAVPAVGSTITNDVSGFFRCGENTQRKNKRETKRFVMRRVVLGTCHDQKTDSSYTTVSYWFISNQATNVFLSFTVRNVTWLYITHRISALSRFLVMTEWRHCENKALRPGK